MQPLNGIHHISAITADATLNLQFNVGVMGLRLVKNSGRAGWSPPASSQRSKATACASMTRRA